MQHTCVGMTRKLRFESSVISYGNQTVVLSCQCVPTFESSVISYGNQTHANPKKDEDQFESSVISYGNQTGRIIHGQDERLKVV